jgi:hypothetical protein
MSLVWSLYCSVCGSFGMLLLAGTALDRTEITTGSIGMSSVETPLIDTSAVNIDTSTANSNDQCKLICIDRYLWSLYERTPKIDAISVPEQTTVMVRRKGKASIITKAITKLLEEDFTWKDLHAAERTEMPLIDYVIGGMDPNFRVTLYHALRALEEIGLMPGITSAFRDDYRQSVATGQKAQNDRSYHGGSFRGGYGHGLAADIVSVNGGTRAERLASSKQLWKWIDTHEKELRIGRPYLDRDPPHVAPIDGEEYAAHRLKANTQHAESKAIKQQPPALHNDQRMSRRARMARLSTVHARSQTDRLDPSPSRLRTARHVVHYRSRS